MDRKRVEWIDIAKGIAILMVLYGHCMRDEMRAISPVLDYTYRIAYIFHMSFFFWLSGYSYEMGRNAFHKEYNGSFLLKKVKKQLLPWVAYTIFIYIAFICAMSLGNTAAVLKNAGYERLAFLSYFGRCLLANNRWAYHLWFIYVLFLITVIVFYVEKLLPQKIAYTGLIVLSIVGIITLRLINLGECERLLNYLFRYTVFYLLGILMYGHLDDIPYQRALGVFGVAYILLRGFLWSGFLGNNVQTGKMWSDILVDNASFIFLPFSFLVLHKVSAMLSKRANWRTDALKWCGRESFMIYLFHQPFCCAFLGTMLYNKLHIPAIVTMAVCCVVSIAVSFAVVCIVNVINCSFKT